MDKRTDLDVKFEGIPTEIEPQQAFEIVPKIQYNCSVEIKEELWQRRSMPIITTTNLLVEPK